MHLKLVHGYGLRVRAIRARDIVVDSKDYRRRCCSAEASSVEPGKYTIVCSTFEPNQLSRFNLLAETTHPVRLALLPREGAGRLRMDMPIASFVRDNNRVAIPLVPKRMLKLYAVARPSNPGSSSSATTSLLRLSIEVGRGPQKRVLTCSGGGEYSDSSAGGIQTDDLDLDPGFLRRRGDVWLVLERMYAHSSAQQVSEERFAVELFVDQPGAVEWGGWRGWED